jgi:glycosyltransferase involved in cell wall biosynthesis
MMASLALLYARWSGKPIFTTDLGSSGIALDHHIDTTLWYSGHLHISEFSRRSSGHDHLRSACVILGGVDVDKFAPNPNTARTNDVLYVGRILPHKGIDYLIQAVDCDTRLTIIGRRWPHAERYFEFLHRLALGKRVTFHENSDDSQIIKSYQRALCIVLPSVYTSVFGERHRIPELLGQTLIEGMACGTPAICTDVGSLPEVVEDGVTGFVVAPNNPVALKSRIDFLKTNPAEARKMGQAARQRVLDRFTWDRTVDRCLHAYGLSLEGARK